jgi:hypothetical protein
VKVAIRSSLGLGPGKAPTMAILRNVRLGTEPVIDAEVGTPNSLLA